MNQENITTSLSNEDKELLFQELSGRLPYGVKFGTTDVKGIWTLSGILVGDNVFSVFPNCNNIRGSQTISPIIVRLDRDREKRV